jgi:hypothetical protein
LTPVAELTAKSTTPVLALPALQQMPIAELPASQQPSAVELSTQQPHNDKFLMQQGDALPKLPTQQGYAPPIMVDDYVKLPSMFEDPDKDDMAPPCIACQLCCNPNSETKDYCFCVNCNEKAQPICTEQMNFQTPALDKLVITQKDFCNMGKE